MMTRENYDAIATKFGTAIREGIELAGGGDIGTDWGPTYGAWLMVDAFIEVAREDNPAFDPDRFKEWVQKIVDTTPTDLP
jgi:hypothetical protein